MERYLAKPTTVEAIQYDGGYRSGAQIMDLLGHDRSWIESGPDGKAEVAIDTGGVAVSTLREGDWLVKNPDGRLWVCPDATFGARYEREPVYG